jgi:hypothetical protein
MADSDSDEDALFEKWNRQKYVNFSAAVAATTYHEDLDDAGQQTVNTSEDVRDVLFILVATSEILKRCTNFTVDEFYELGHHLSPVLYMTARSAGNLCKGAGRPPKLSAQQHILNTLMYLKHVNTVHYEDFQWNLSKGSVSDDVIFDFSVINTVLAHEI